VKARAVRDVAWSGLEAAGSACFSILSAFVVARLIGPAEVGVGAAAVATHVLLWVGVTALFADAIVQRPELDATTAASAFWASTAVGAMAALVQVGCGWPLVRTLHDHRLIGMSLALASPLPLVGAAGVVQGRLTRERRYGLLACRALIGQGAGTVVGIGCALNGAGAWALAAQQATTSACGGLVLMLAAGWRPSLLCHWRPVRELLHIGLPLTASTLVLHGRYRIFSVLIGSTAGVAALGEVHMAFRLVDTVRELASTALWRLLLPHMAERQRDLPALRHSVDQLLRTAALALFPLCGAMLVTIVPVTRWLLGPVWAASGRAAQPLIVLAIFSFLVFPSGVAAIARGAPRYALNANIAATVALIVGVLIWRPHGPIQSVAIWIAVQLLVAPYTLRMNAGVLGTSAWQVVRAGITPLLLTAAVVLIAMGLPPERLTTPALIILRVSVGGILYLLAALLFLGRRYELRSWRAGPRRAQ
jgi:O-antigen/teichoic acid export membrane protein